MCSATSFVNFLVTTCTERNQIVFVVCAAVGNRFYVMYQIRRDIFSLSFAQLAQRILTNVSVAYLLPCAAVAFFVVIAASEFVVVPSHRFLMLDAVAALVIGKLWTTDETAGAFRFCGHNFLQTKSPRRHRVEGLFNPLVSVSYQSQGYERNVNFCEL